MQGIQPYGDNFIPVIPDAGNSIQHTAEEPFCCDPTCICHEDKQAILGVNDYVMAGLLTPNEATDLTLGKKV